MSSSAASSSADSKRVEEVVGDDEDGVTTITVAPNEISNGVDVDVIDSTTLPSSSSDIEILPKFRVEGTGAGDSSIRVAVASISSAALVNSHHHHHHHLPQTIEEEEIDINKLSLVSWYSEPGEGVVIGGGAGTMRQDGVTGTMTRSLEEKENLTPEVGGSRDSIVPVLEEDSKHHHHHQKTNKSQVFLETSSSASNNKRPECNRCTRRTKSGNATPPATVPRVNQASRRVIPSTKRSAELKKPIKSILKNDSKSGSGSDNNKSSMDSLGSVGKSEGSGGGGRAKFNLNHQIFDVTPKRSSVDVESKLRRIEKYATLRLRKGSKVHKSLEMGSDSEISGITDVASSSKSGTPTDLMTKSMSFLEKSRDRDRDARSSTSSGGSGSATLLSNANLKRQGSLRMKRGSPQWEPCITRTTALRLQKMQETKAKGGIGITPYLSTPMDSTHQHHHNQNARLSDSSNASSSSLKPDRFKVFAKLSSPMGQTASSNQKRLRQDKGIQTDVAETMMSRSIDKSMSPIPSVDPTADFISQIRKLEQLANRYRTTALKLQAEYDKSETRRIEMARQLQETQAESNELIEFLKAEKSILSESLTEVEAEARSWRDQFEAVKKDSDLKCSNLVNEKHRQDMLHDVETQSTSLMTSLLNDFAKGTSSLVEIKQKITAVTERLLQLYKITDVDNIICDGNDTTTPDTTKSLLIPLASSLAHAFPSNKEDYSRLINTDCSTVQNLHRTTLHIEAAKNFGISVPSVLQDHPISDETTHLGSAIERLLLVIRIILLQCDKRLSTVTSSILKCLVEDGGENNKEDGVVNRKMEAVQRSLETWQLGGGVEPHHPPPTNGHTTTTNHN